MLRSFLPALALALLATVLGCAPCPIPPPPSTNEASVEPCFADDAGLDAQDADAGPYVRSTYVRSPTPGAVLMTMAQCAFGGRALVGSCQSDAPELLITRGALSRTLPPAGYEGIRCEALHVGAQGQAYTLTASVTCER